MTRPRLAWFTIPASAPFLPTLVGALVEGRLVPGFPAADDHWRWPRATLLLADAPRLSAGTRRLS